jgi:hypothetical protein
MNMKLLSSPPNLIMGLFVCFLLVQCKQEEPSLRVEGLEHVIVIGVDGLSPDGIRNAETPVMDELREGGAATLRARAVLPTSSSPNWASMIMGAGPAQHGITSNAWQPDDFVLPTAAADETGYFPTIFSILHKQEPEAEIGAIYDWEGFGRLFSHEHVDFHTSPDSEEATAEEAMRYIREKRPRFCFIHFDHVDHAGHTHGHGTPAYYRAVEKADSLIGIVLETLKTEGLLDRSLVLLTADHGGVGLGHGGETPEEVEIPFILFGKGIKKGYEIAGFVNTYDNAATVASALGLEIPHPWIGRPVAEAFAGRPAPKGDYQRKELIRQPLIEPRQDGIEVAGGLFIDTLPMLNIKNPNDMGEIRYTLDGSTPDAGSPVFEAPVRIERNAIVQAVVFAEGEPVSKEAAGYFRILTAEEAFGVRYDCYEEENMDKLPDFDRLKPASSGAAHEFSLQHVELPREEQVAVVFESDLTVEKEGEYTFYLASDDGSKLYVNDRQVVDNDGDHGVIERAGTIELTPGKHRIRVAWFNGGGGMALQAYYKGPGVPKQIIPGNRLSN